MPVMHQYSGCIQCFPSLILQQSKERAQLCQPSSSSCSLEPATHLFFNLLGFHFGFALLGGTQGIGQADPNVRWGARDARRRHGRGRGAAGCFFTLFPLPKIKVNTTIIEDPGLHRGRVEQSRPCTVSQQFTDILCLPALHSSFTNFSESFSLPQRPIPAHQSFPQRAQRRSQLASCHN